MSEQRVTRERVGAVTVITLNRPEAYNALDLQLGEELLDALIECDEDQGVRAVVLTGAGRAFCAGGDIRAMDASGSAGGAAAFLKKLTVFLHSAVATVSWMPKPVIAAVNGPAAGAGFSLALARAKRLLSLGTGGSLETQMEHERGAISECGRTEDFREGIRAFLEKRAPTFAGR